MMGRRRLLGLRRMTRPNGPTVYEPVGSAEPPSHSDCVVPISSGNPVPPGEFTYLLTGQTFSKSSRTGQAAPSAAVVGVNISSPTISQPWLTVYEHSML